MSKLKTEKWPMKLVTWKLLVTKTRAVAEVGWRRKMDEREDRHDWKVKK